MDTPALTWSGPTAESPCPAENMPPSWGGLRLERCTTAPGTISVAAVEDNLIRVHAGAPVRGACHSQPFVYERGDIDLFPIGAADTWREHDPSTYILMQVSRTLLRRAAQDSGRDPERTQLDPRHQFRDAQIEHIAMALDAERMSGYPTGAVYAESLALALAVRLLGENPIAPPALTGRLRRQIQRTIEYIDAHLERELSLTELATVAGMSASMLKSCFRQHTGTSVHRYVIERRVERAKAMLLDGGLPVSQVALEVGFSHQSHLARWMRRLLGLTPSALLRFGGRPTK